MQKKVELPLDGDVYKESLEKLIEESHIIKPETIMNIKVNMKDSFK
jgi:hypothetical protein